MGVQGVQEKNRRSSPMQGCGVQRAEGGRRRAGQATGLRRRQGEPPANRAPHGDLSGTRTREVKPTRAHFTSLVRMNPEFCFCFTPHCRCRSYASACPRHSRSPRKAVESGMVYCFERPGWGRWGSGDVQSAASPVPCIRRSLSCPVVKTATACLTADRLPSTPICRTLGLRTD